MRMIRNAITAALGTTRMPVVDPNQWDHAAIAALNDQLRRDPKNATNGRVVLTAGVMAILDGDGRSLLDKFLRHGRLNKALAEYRDFGIDHDPHGEHDFGGFVFEGRNLLFKIDYYDLAMESCSPNPADPSATVRVLTVMTEDEY